MPRSESEQIVGYRRCTRLDDHPEHEWRGRESSLDMYDNPKVRTYICRGKTVIEGGWR